AQFRCGTMVVIERRMLGYLVSVATRRLLLRVAGEDVLMKHRIWEIDGKVLTLNALFSDSSGKKFFQNNGALRTLNQRVQGSSPCAPTSFHHKNQFVTAKSGRGFVYEKKL